MKIAPEILPHPPTTLAVWVACVFAGLLSAQTEPPLPTAGSRAPAGGPPPIPAANNSPIPFQVPGTTPPQGPPLPGSAADGSPPSPGVTSKISTSNSGGGQFVIHGKDLQTRSPFSVRCAEVAERLRRLLRDEEPWVLPVVVALKTAPDLNLAEPPVKTSISKITTGGFHLQVTVQIRSDLRPAALDAEITRILIAERILRNHAEITTKRSMVLPDWLLTGISQAMTFRDRSRPSAVFAAIFRSGKIYGIEEILDTAPGELDALSRTLYETSCCALVLALLDQVDGPMRLRTFLSMLAVDSRDDRALLNFCFPTLALSSSSLNKWWSLQMASLATPTVFETLGPTDTKTALADALTLRYESPSDSAPKPRIASTAPKPRAPAATTPAEEEKLAEEKKPGFLGRLIGMGPSEAKDEPKDDAEKKTKAEPPAEKPKDSKTEVAAETTAEEKKPGFLGRMFGANGDDEKPKETKAEEPQVETKAPEIAKTEPKEKEKPKAEPEKKAATPKPEAAPESKPKTKAEEKPSAGEEPTEPKKRGFLGRMFGGGDSKDEKAAEPEKSGDSKEKKKKSDDKPADDQSSALPNGQLDLTSLFDARRLPPSPGPVLVQQPVWSLEGIWSAFFTNGTALWEAWAPESGRPVILGFGKKKKSEEEAPEAEKPKEEEKKKEEPKPKPSKKKEEKKEPEKEADKAKKEDPKPEPPAKASPPPPTSAPKPTATAAKPRLVPVSVPIEQYTVILKRKDRDAILDRSAKALAALAQRANVLFRPLINDYIAVIADLQVDKTKDMAARLSALKAKTEEIYARAKAVEDHLDWFEASETKNYSGIFEDYLRLPEEIQKELPPREDPIAKYLDEVEAQVGK